MPRYLLTRILYTIPVIWLVVSLVFLLIHLVPGDPIAQMLGEGAPAADLQAARHAYGAHFTSPVDIMKIVGPTIVVHGTDAGSKLEKARQMGIETLDEEQFLTLIIDK